jgi:hypothetical protein
MVSLNINGKAHEVDVDPEVGQPVVAHVFGAVAVEAVVDEDPRTALDRGCIARINRRPIELHLLTRRKRFEREQQTQKKEGSHDCRI